MKYIQYISAKEAADKWGISQRRVASLCSDGRINFAQRVGNMWIIPADAEKPEDGRHSRYQGENLGVTKTQSERIASEAMITESIKPFLKWAGGKGQLLSTIQEYYPFKENNITRYAEPFVGGGAVLFDILNHYDLEEVYISDINAELINTYKAIRDDVEGLISLLQVMEDEYVPLENEERKVYFYEKRARFNELKAKESDELDLEKAALMIFLNKTCFNGLYRVNKKGQFNVPMGGYKRPTICDAKNLKAVSERLQGVTIVHGDYKQSESFVNASTFVYFDPPYRPITESASFTAYTEYDFNDKEQKELANFVNAISKKGARIVLSNSDPKNIDEEDNFFDDIYAAHSIRRVEAARMINSNGNKRGKIKELLISNF